jgi:hypothetical protein
MLIGLPVAVIDIHADIHMYIYIYVCVCVCVERESFKEIIVCREIQREGDREKGYAEMEILKPYN